MVTPRLDQPEIRVVRMSDHALAVGLGRVANVMRPYIEAITA